MVQNHMGKKKSAVAHVGYERFNTLTQIAIDISGQSRQQITGSAFLKFVIDNFSGQAKELLLRQWAEESNTSEG